MQGRHAKPIQMHLEDGKSRLTAETKKLRQQLESELRFGTHDFVPPENVKKDTAAKKKWDEIIRLYISGNIEFVTTADTDCVAGYCLLYSHLQYLLDRRKDILSRIEQKTGTVDEVKNYYALSKMGVGREINRTYELLLKYSGQLYLTPASRISAITPKRPKKGESELEKMGFDNV